MIHSRPGFAPRKDDTEAAALNQDMIPALHRKSPKESSPLVNASPSLEAMLTARAEEHNHRSAKIHAAPELLVNPAPSAVPLVNEPGE